MSEDGADILHLPDREGRPLVDASDRRRCPHLRTGRTVHAESRVVVCRRCGAQMEPIDVLLEIADSNASLVAWRKSLRKEGDALVERIETLKRDERNAKARLARAERKEPVNVERKRILDGIDNAAASIPARTESKDYRYGILFAFQEVVRFIGGPDSRPMWTQLQKIHRQLRSQREPANG